MKGFHENAKCGVCGGPLEEDRDAVCHRCTAERQGWLITKIELPPPLTIRCRCMRCGDLMVKDVEDDWMPELCNGCWHKGPEKGTPAWWRWVHRYQKNRDDHVLWFVSRVLDGDADAAEFGKRVGP